MIFDGIKEGARISGIHSYMDDDEGKDETIESTLKCLKETLKGLRPGEVFSYVVKEQKPVSLQDLIDVTKEQRPL